MLIAAAATGLLAWGSAKGARPLRVGVSVLAPLCFLLVPILQSVPIPLSLRRVVDPKGTALLVDDSIEPTSVAPLSLDPPNTRADIGKAAAALAIFVAAYHLASGQRRRQLLLRAIGAAGIGAVLIGVGHRIVGAAKIYGVLVSTHRTLLIGPFVNANHTCEFLELAAFVCLACSFQRPTAFNRVGWILGMSLCLGGAAATLSRGGMVAITMAVLMFVFLHYFAKAQSENNLNRRRVSLAWGGLLLGLVVLGAGAFGADRLIERFQSGTVSGDIRFHLWRDSLKVLAAHPFGIGRGAFDHVFPVYRTLKTDFPLRFAFVENEPLQLLLDSGWILFAALGIAVGFLIWQIVRHGRRDNIDAALIAALFAIVVHNLVDFGLETLGVLLPVMAVLGTLLGRAQPPTGPTLGARWRHLVVGLTCGGLVLGLASIAHGSYDNFDALLKTQPLKGRKELLIRAQHAHPTDYYYALLFATLQPLKAPQGGPSPRFHALNRALMLCPSCDAVHADVARNLWALGLRRQALLEWRTAVTLQPDLLSPLLGELFAAGASPQELASVAASDPPRMISAASFLGSIGRFNEALAVLDQAEALGASRKEIILTRARLQLQAGQTTNASATLTQAHALGIRDVRLALFDAQVLLAEKGPLGADSALAILDEAATQYPLDVAVQRARINLVMTYEKWQAADRALEGFKQALYRDVGTAVEAHLASARISARLSRWNNALGEYRVALADGMSEVSLWMEYGRVAESAGRNATAREAYSEAARLSPNNPEIAKALQQLDDQQAKLRALGRDLMRDKSGEP